MEGDARAQLDRPERRIAVRGDLLREPVDDLAVLVVGHEPVEKLVGAREVEVVATLTPSFNNLDFARTYQLFDGLVTLRPARRDLSQRARGGDHPRTAMRRSGRSSCARASPSTTARTSRPTM